MNNRATRRKIAEETLEILERGYYENSKGEKVDIRELQEKAEKLTTLYSPEESDSLLENLIATNQEELTEIKITNQTTLDAVRELISEGYKDVLCLNFASARNPGGGFLGGSQAQEESLARSTGLYNCQLISFKYYEINRNTKSCIYTDYMIYSPFVPIIKNESGLNLDELNHCGIITAPAVNKGVVKQKEPEKLNDIEEIMKKRIRKVLAISLENNHKTIVLGAWGCGVFQNDPIDIARYFKEILSSDFKNRFKKIVFAIYSRNERFINAFYNEFR